MALSGRPEWGRSFGKALAKLGLALVSGLVIGSFAGSPALAKALAFQDAIARDSEQVVAQADRQWLPKVRDGGAGSMATIPFGALPPEAQTTSTLIRQGGPFPYGKDGVVFGNRERSLPTQHRGYYREYTVPTPHARDRGARRIVCGGRQPTAPDACYYTNDHYATFRLIAQ